MKAKQQALLLSAAVLASLHSAHAAPTLSFVATNLPTAEGLVFDSAGNLYCGSASVIYEFSGPNRQTQTAIQTTAPFPYGDNIRAIAIDPAGDLFAASELGSYNDDGSVVELSGPNHQTLTVLSNVNNSGAQYPKTLMYSGGSLYCTTESSIGGSPEILRISGPTFQTLTWTGIGSPGNIPGVAIDGSGNIYGTTTGLDKQGYATVFKLPASFQNNQTPAAVFNYNTSAHGIGPDSVLSLDAAGNLYGTTVTSFNGSGVAYEISADRQTFTVLANFNGSGANETYSALIADANGNLFGTTQYGGLYGQGIVYELSGANHQTVTDLADYQNADGTSPIGALSYDAQGNLYGIASTYKESPADIFELTGTGFVPPPVPEPSALSLLAIGGFGLLRRKIRPQWRPDNQKNSVSVGHD